MMKKIYRIRLAEDRDLPFLPELEARSAGLVPGNALPRWMRGKTLGMSDFFQARRSGSLWVAECRRELVGFAMAVDFDELVLLYEVNVLPDKASRGLGGALVASVVRCALEKAHERLWAAAFGGLHWELNFYGSLGFKLMYGWGDIPKPVRELLDAENRSGLANRVAMYRDLRPVGHA